MTQSSSITAGLDLGDRYGQLCLIDAQSSGEVIEEGRLSTNPKALERRFSGSEPMRVAIEAGTHSPWVSRLLKRCGHTRCWSRTPARQGSSMAKGARTTGSTP